MCLGLQMGVKNNLAPRGPPTNHVLPSPNDTSTWISPVWRVQSGDKLVLQHCMFRCTCTARSGYDRRFQKITAKITADRPGYRIVHHAYIEPHVIASPRRVRDQVMELHHARARPGIDVMSAMWSASARATSRSRAWRVNSEFNTHLTSQFKWGFTASDLAVLLQLPIYIYISR